jgi:hypothetical protein
MFAFWMSTTSLIQNYELSRTSGLMLSQVSGPAVQRTKCADIINDLLA